MKMRAKKAVKLLMVAALSSLMLVGCGKDNKSSSNSSRNDFNYPGTTFTGNGSNLPNNWLDILMSENRCMDMGMGNTSNRRVRIQIPLQGMNVNAASLYVGITYEGDVGVVTQRNGTGILDLYACPRPDLRSNAQGFIMSANGMPPVLNTSLNCALGEITAMNAGVNTQMGGYQFAFYPIYLNGANKPNGSSLCQF